LLREPRLVSHSAKVGRYRDILLTHGIPSAPERVLTVTG